jgi:hypothetical protein
MKCHCQILVMVSTGGFLDAKGGALSKAYTGLPERLFLFQGFPG